MARLCESGNNPEERDELHRDVITGVRMSLSCLSSHVGIGSKMRQITMATRASKLPFIQRQHLLFA